MTESLRPADSDVNEGFVAVCGDCATEPIVLNQHPHFTGQMDVYIGKLVVAPEVARIEVSHALVLRPNPRREYQVLSASSRRPAPPTP